MDIVVLMTSETNETTEKKEVKPMTGVVELNVRNGQVYLRDVIRELFGFPTDGKVYAVPRKRGEGLLLLPKQPTSEVTE